MFLCGLSTEYRPFWRDFSSGSVGSPGSHSTLQVLTPAQPCTTSLPSACPSAKKPVPAKIVCPGICTLVSEMFGPHGTSEQPTFTPAFSACLIVGVSGPPSFGPTYQASYFFETSASRSWLSCLLVVNWPSNTVSLTSGFFFWTSFAPSSEASQYVFADEARNTAMLIVFFFFAGLPAA